MHETASRDVEDRDLTRATKQAVAILGNHIGRAQRRVCAEVLRRSLFLHHWINSHRHISRMETLATLAERAKAIIQDVSLDDATMVRLGCDQALLAARGWTPATWLELAATLEYDDQELAQVAIADVTKLHLELTTRGTAHLSLVIENIMRTSWLAGATLQPNPVQAQTAAQELLRHLDTVAPARRSAFEQHLADTDELLEALRAFAARKVAVCLWKGQGEYRVLFQFLAMRFLLAPDQVLDCERSHARWNWICLSKRSLRLPAMNAQLRLTAYLEAHHDEFPTHEELRPHLEMEAEAHRQALANANADEQVAPGFRAHLIFLERFNLRAADLDLFADDPGAHGAPVRFRSDFEETASVYLRNTFVPRRFFHAPTLAEDTYVFVLENKVLSGREQRDGSDAQTRPLVVCFFQEAPGVGAPGELVVKRIDTGFPGT